jgi:hypothetical protein
VTADGWLGGVIGGNSWVGREVRTADGWLGGAIGGDGWVGREVRTADGWLGDVIDSDGWVGGGVINDGCVVGVVDDGGAVSGLGNTYLPLVCLKNRGGNAWRLVPCVRFRDLKRCRSSSVVFLSTRLPLPEPGNCLVTRIQSI